MTDQANVTLTLSVTYDLNGVSPHALAHLLVSGIQRMTQEGALSGYTDAEVDTWTVDTKIREIK